MDEDFDGDEINEELEVSLRRAISTASLRNRGKGDGKDKEFEEYWKRVIRKMEEERRE